MTLLTLAVKNVRHQFRSYAAFFLSSAFAVWLFFLYSSLVFAPAFGPNRVPGNLRYMMQVMQAVVALFALLFTLYAHSAFIKSRQRELGLLTLSGMLPGQIAGTIWCENLVVGLAAIATGIGTGAVCAPLFFLGIGRILVLAEPAPFSFSSKAALLTLAGFTCLFSLISLTTLRTLRRLSVAEVLRESVKPQTPPRFSPWLAAICLALLGSFYYLAFSSTAANLSNNRSNGMILLGFGGTYLLFTQGSALVLQLLKQRRELYWQGPNLVNIAQLSYKMRDNARILFMITILTTGVLTLISMLYGGYLGADGQAEQQYPVSLIVSAPSTQPGLDQIDTILQDEGLSITATERIPALQGSIGFTRNGAHNFAGAPVTSVTGFNRWAGTLTHASPLAVAPGAVAIVMPGSWIQFPPDAPVDLFLDPASPRTGVPDLRLPLSVLRVEKVFNESLVVVVDDQTFADLQGRYRAPSLYLSGWSFAQWRGSLPATLRILDALGINRQRALIGGQSLVSGPALDAYIQRHGMGFVFFLLGFISILFFLAAGNMLYFKLFTDLQEDRLQFQALFKLGLGADDVRRMISIQTFTLFFTPFVVAGLHTAAILYMMRLAMNGSLWWPLAVVSLLYLALHGAYFLVTRRTYTQAVLAQ